MKFSGPKADVQARRYLLRKIVAMTGLRTSASWNPRYPTLLDFVSEALNDDEDFVLVKRELKAVTADIRRLLVKA